MSIHQARKRFGQNFLQDKHIIQDIIRAVRPEPNDIIIEIGPGLAAITEPLCHRTNQLHVIEIDKDIVAILKKSAFANHLIIHEGDVLNFNFDQINGHKKIVGNLPYNISTPLLFKLTQYAESIIDMHFMLQKEVVNRMVATPHTNNYGRLSVMLQYFFDMELLIEVPPSAFKPAPKVDSAVIRMIPQSGRMGIAANFEIFSDLVKQSFHQKRKTIHNNLKNYISDEMLLAVGIHPSDRPEQIAPEKYVTLSNQITTFTPHL